MTTGSATARYRISDASRRVGLHPRTLMLYERLGLIVPERRGNQRRYSDDDLRWLGCIQEINHRGGVSLAGIRAFLHYLPCWALRSCALRTARDGRPERFDCEAAAEGVRRVLDGQAMQSCRECGYYQEAVAIPPRGRSGRTEN